MIWRQDLDGSLATWEMIALGGLAIVLIFLIVPGIKKIQEESRKAEKDWKGVLLPLGAVVLFVIFLIAVV